MSETTKRVKVRNAIRKHLSEHRDGPRLTRDDWDWIANEVADLIPKLGLVADPRPLGDTHE